MGCDSPPAPAAPLSSQVSKEGLDRLVADVRQKEERRSTFSRRRAHNADADVDYINERNARFNKKLGALPALATYGRFASFLRMLVLPFGRAGRTLLR